MIEEPGAYSSYFGESKEQKFGIHFPAEMCEKMCEEIP